MLTDGQTNSLTPFKLERVLLWQFNVASNHATYLDVQVKCLILIKFVFFHSVLTEVFQYMISWRSNKRSSADACRWTDTIQVTRHVLWLCEHA